jgi:hypothetical protein
VSGVSFWHAVSYCHKERTGEGALMLWALSTPALTGVGPPLLIEGEPFRESAGRDGYEVSPDALHLDGAEK